MYPLALIYAIAEALAKSAASAIGTEIGKIAAGHIVHWIEGQPEADRPALSAAASALLGEMHAAIPRATGGILNASSSTPPAGVGS